MYYALVTSYVPKKNYKQFEYKWNIEDAVGWQMFNLAEIFIFYDFQNFKLVNKLKFIIKLKIFQYDNGAN